jgi:hypothetical protein
MFAPHLLPRQCSPADLRAGSPDCATVVHEAIRTDASDEYRRRGLDLRGRSFGTHRVMAFDGRTLRGTRDAAGNLVHLLAGLCQHTGVVIGQVAVVRRPTRSRCWPAC